MCRCALAQVIAALSQLVENSYQIGDHVVEKKIAIQNMFPQPSWNILPICSMV
jgi:hypothetical protein